ncbi:MAG: hypothetical protein P1P71_04345 [Anaerosomatales bacterium]|nr:hypothetical protein [Anaerosomatales bacterium]
MKRITFVLVLAVVLTMVFSATAFAEHRSSKYSQWNPDAAGNAATAGSPHAEYTTTTVKCNVCHAVHNAAVMGQYIQNQPGGDWILSSETAPTEMLLRSSVADSCSYCHIDTSTGGVRLWNGNSDNWGRITIDGTRYEKAFDSGYGHGHSGCSGCHAVHGAKAFKGAVAGKVLRYDADNNLRKGSHLGDPDGDGPLSSDSSAYDIGINGLVAGNVANHTYTDPVTGIATLTGIQDEVFTPYSVETSQLVGPENLPWFASLADLIEGTNPINEAVGENMKDLQVGGFCTMCHANIFTSDSFQVINPDQDTFLAGGSFGPWLDVEGFEYESGFYKSKGHPVREATDTFSARGDTTAATTVAWSDADVCRKCHDGGSSDAPAGIVYSSFPHVTPGYYKFVGAGPDAATYSAYDTKNGMVGEGEWLAGEEWLGLEGDLSPLVAAGAYLYDGQNYKSDNTADPMETDHIGVDGLCLKCHVSGTGMGVGLTY